MDWQIHCHGEANSALKAMCHDQQIALHVFPWEPAMKKAGLKRNSVYVIRPDGHIGIVDPMGTNPIFFEDPRIDTEVRARRVA